MKGPTILLQSLLVLFVIVSPVVALYRLTKEDSAHIGQVYTPLAIVDEFRDWIEDSPAFSAKVANNSYTQHHQLVQAFCLQRKNDGLIDDYDDDDRDDSTACTYEEYYEILDDIREPFSKLWDPEASGLTISELRQIGQGIPDCMKMNGLDAQSLARAAQYSKPLIITGVADDWLATKRWTYDYLRQHAGTANIVASATPSGRFDGPESARKWGLEMKERGNLTHNIILARPGQLNMKLEQFISALVHARERQKKKQKMINRMQTKKQKKKGKNMQKKKGKKNKKKTKYTQSNARTRATSLYLEYFPVAALGLQNDGGLLERDLGDIPAASFFKLKHHLLWFGSGGTVGCTHYDNHENIMVMIRGAKTFHLAPPTEGHNVYAGKTFRTASFDVKRVDQYDDIDKQIKRYENQAKEWGEFIEVSGDFQFSRNRSKVSDFLKQQSTYSPVSLLHKNYKRFPKLKQAETISCRVEEGEMIFVPSSWWHEVESHPDDEGKTIGINYFFEPFYTFVGQDPVSEHFRANNYYQHIRYEERSVIKAEGCPNNAKLICFRDKDKFVKEFQQDSNIRRHKDEL